MSNKSTVVVLAGGTGGAKFARGMLDVVGDELVVIANTGDDIEIHDAYVSPDPDLICFSLADRIDARGWGLEGDTFEYMRTRDHWFNLGDEDRAIGIRRLHHIRSGGTLTEAIAALTAELNIHATVLPMSDAPVRTEVFTDGVWTGFQEFMVRGRAQGDIADVRFCGASTASPTPQVLEAIAEARAIIIGPSNPVASIGPILAVAGSVLQAAAAPVVAVSPIVGKEVLKGPTKAFMKWAGHPADAAGVAAYYGAIINGMVADETVASVPCLRADTLLTASTRAAVAQRTLAFALGL
ncbi:MAG TPA: 2-phospho-L-lactate transferase CofD family protein [Baekduia sp.]|nr:2-phospho-L-lactate transferase CofD family protein [Baekduia sp.]